MAIIYDESSADYHNNTAIGSGSIRAYLRSPKLFHDYNSGIFKENSSSLIFGIAAHMALLEPDLFTKVAAVKPESMKLSTKEGIAWKAANADKIIVGNDDAETIQTMRFRMPKPVIDIFARCKKEVTVRTKIDGLDVQCRPDLWDMDNSEKFDLKTTKSVESIESSIWRLGYHVQEAWYSAVIKAETGLKPPSSKLIFVEKLPPFRWRIVSLDPDYQALANQAVGIAIRGINERIKTGNWDESEDELESIVSPPEWATEFLPFNQEIEE